MSNSVDPDANTAFSTPIPDADCPASTDPDTDECVMFIPPDTDNSPATADKATIEPARAVNPIFFMFIIFLLFIIVIIYMNAK